VKTSELRKELAGLRDGDPRRTQILSQLNDIYSRQYPEQKRA
jgi:hypothetical protein